VIVLIKDDLFLEEYNYFLVAFLNDLFLSPIENRENLKFK